MSTLPPHPSARAQEAAASPQTVAWKLTRNCAIAPATFFWNLGALALITAVIGAGYWFAGYPLVMLFCGAQIGALFIAGLVYSRHANDGERIRVEGDAVYVETSHGGRAREDNFHACWVRLDRDPSGALTLCSSGASLPLGEQLTPARRRIFVDEFAARIARSGQSVASVSDAHRNDAH
jgi:uncharacterized membrane protein